MRLNPIAATSIASALPSCRVLLLFGAALLLSESLVLASALFAGACVSFAASLVLGAKIYRGSRARRFAEGADGGFQATREFTEMRSRVCGMQPSPRTQRVGINA